MNILGAGDGLSAQAKGRGYSGKRKSPVALQMGKQAFYGMSDMEFGKALEYSNEMFASLCVTEDPTEGINAFLEKWEPDWKGK